MENQINYYTKHSPMTDISMHQDFINELPKQVIEISHIIQNVLLHNHVQHYYGVISDKSLSQKELPLRSMDEIIQGFKNRGMTNLTDKREPNQRLLGICRDFSLIMTSFLREKGIPARARCGFATYLEQNKFIDHWICEYYSKDDNRWIMFDSQIDDLLKDLFQSAMGKVIDFTDVKSHEFIKAGQAWQLTRRGEQAPSLFGILDWWGYDYLICNLILDINSVLKTPMQPWDIWPGFKSKQSVDLQECDWLLLDQAADLLVKDDIKGLRELVNTHSHLGVPKDLSQVVCSLL